MRRGFSAIAAVLALALCSAGCVMPDQVSQMQKDLADVRRQLNQIEQDQDSTEQSLARVEAEIGENDSSVDRAEMADLSQLVQQVSRDLRVTDERVKDIHGRIDRLTQEVQQNRELARRGALATPPAGGALDSGNEAPSSVSPGSAAPGSTIADPEALYNAAYADFSKGNYALAVSGFEEYQETYPGSALADNALYWVGECHFSQGSFGQAIESFDRLLELYPKSDKAAAGNLKKALSYLEQNEIGTAIVQFRYVVSSYPGSDEAKIAQDKLTSLGAPI